MFDQQSPDAALPEARLDEQPIELGIAIRPDDDRGESDHHVVLLRDEDVAICELLARQRDRVRMREQGIAIAGVGERGAPLQRLEAGTLRLPCRTDDHLRHPAILPAGVRAVPRSAGTSWATLRSVKAGDRVAQLLVVVTIATTVTFGLKRGLFVAAAADAYGYVSQADLWARGQLVIHQPFAVQMTWPNATASLAPLGYRPHTADPADKDIVPIYSPGLPMLMAVFKSIAGSRAVFWVVPLLGGLALWATYLLGARLAGPAVGAAAAVLMAASPTFLFEVVSPTSDVPCTAWWALALALVTFEGRWPALAAGIAAGVAILTRPNLVPLAAIPAAMLVWRSIQSRTAPATADMRASADATTRMLLFAAGAVPACIAVALIDRHLYGSALATGYGPFESLYSWSFLGKNLARYPGWVVQTETAIVLLAFIAPFVLKPEPSMPGRERHPRRLAVVWLSFVALNVLLYLFYLPWDEWWYVRFLMPSYPPMLALTAAALWALAAPLERLLPGAQGLVAATAVAAVSWHGVSFSLERGAQLQWVAEQRYKTVGAYVDSTLPHRAVLICMQHSGSAHFCSGRITVRYDVLEPRDLTLAVAQLRRLGYVPYLLLEDWEEPLFRARFAGQTPLGRLDWPPIAGVYGNRVHIYDTEGR